MLGTRGVRLGVLHPEIYEMQARAIVRAAQAVAGRSGEAPAARDHDPAGGLREGARADARAGAAAWSRRRAASDLDVTIGTMIELPRACFVADRIAEHADFFSFGTNDLTQTALGFSRDDVEGSFLAAVHREEDRRPQPVRDDRPARRGLARPPGRLDRARGQARAEARRLRRARRATPTRSRFFQLAGLDYVSCSPYRVPIARVAAAQAAIGD